MHLVFNIAFIGAGLLSTPYIASMDTTQAPGITHVVALLTIPSDTDTLQLMVPKTYSCTVCQKTFTKSRSLISHTISHGYKTVYRCNLNGCTKEYVRHSPLIKHMQKHKQSLEEHLYACPFESCNTFWESVLALSDHLKTAH